VKLLFDNPELIRNARIQLRPGRMIAAAVICAVVSITVWISIVRTGSEIVIDGMTQAGAVFALILTLQIAILLIAGGIFCLQSVHREKEMNTFDYQRVTRLTSLELAIGKLFGAPILAYVLVLCLMPVALTGAVVAKLAAQDVIMAYVLVLLGCVAFHALMLLVSVLLGRSGIAVSMLLFLMLVAASSTDFAELQSPWAIHRLNPFYVLDLFSHHLFVWGPQASISFQDSFWGVSVPHTAVLVVLYATFTAWFLAAVARNMKRDPSAYEILPAPGMFLFVMYVNFLMLSFLSWKTAPEGEETVPALLVLSLWSLWLLAFVLLRNRGKVRGRSRKLLGQAASWWAALWPAPYLALGAAIVGGTTVVLTAYHREPGSYWSWHMAAYYVAFLIVWLSRDALYLQWMALRRAKHPLGSAVVYLAIFYVCTSVVFVAFDIYENARGAAFTAAFIPSAFFVLNDRLWGPAMRVWMMPLFLQAAAAFAFAWLHKQRLAEFITEPEGRVSSADIAQSA